MMRVALNGRFTGTPQPTGTQTAAYHLFEQIVRAESGCEFVVFGDSRFLEISRWRDLARVTFVDTPFQDWSRGRAQLWEQFQLPALCRRHGCAVVHHPINTSPALFRGGAKSVVTLHDLNFLRHPDWYSARFRLIYSFCTLPGLRHADRVVTISNYVLGTVRKHLRLPDERLRMISNGSKPLAPAAEPPGGSGRYILCVGAIPPHKNLARLIRAFLAVRREDSGLELRVVGRPVARHAQDPALPGLFAAEGVHALGYLSEAELGAAYAHAEVFCYPSLEEGFGLPLLEAMTMGCPVVTSNVSCLPEVAGPSAVLVDPRSVEAIADGLRTVLNFSADERARRAAAGREWAARFTWAEAARKYLDLYREFE